MTKIALILAGGTGAKLWPKSIEKQPKQFVHFIGEGTMLVNTYLRLMPVFPPENIFVVTPQQFKHLVSEQLPELPEENIILEPFPRNTAPCIALALTQLSKKFDKNTIVATFPSDHVIYNIREFHHSLDVAINVANERNGIVTLGIKPTRPETSYGYIQVKQNSQDLGFLYDNGVRYTTTFAEKPDLETAKRFLETGDFLWNSGIFVFKYDEFWREFDLYLPEQSKIFKVLKKFVGKESYPIALEDSYKKIDSVSIDYAILEKANNVFVVESSFNWSDLSNWDEVYRLSMKDGRDNFIEGDVITINVTNSYIYSEEKLVAISDIDNIIVVHTEDALLICRRGKSENVQEIIDYMKRKQIIKFI
jgi:mannose-1-phosphate guanylyltransferase